MTLSEAIEEVNRDAESEGEYGWHEFDNFGDELAEAIATILNAVVKGELRAEEKQDPYWTTY